MKPAGLQKNRTSKRLTNYDYSSKGGYFITLVTHKRKMLFGTIVDERLRLSEFGEIAQEEWIKSPKYRREIEQYENEFVIMPNHIHGIVWINDLKCVGATGQSPLRQEDDVRHGPKPKSLGSFIIGYKTSVTKRINRIRSTPGKSVWMRNYHDRIIRNDRELTAIRRYIQENPLKWALDRHNIR